MGINLTVQDGVVKSPALRYDSNSKPELRFTLVQTEKDWPLYLPCTAVGAAAERLASEIEDGQHIIVTSGKLCTGNGTPKSLASRADSKFSSGVQTCFQASTTRRLQRRPRQFYVGGT